MKTSSTSAVYFLGGIQPGAANCISMYMVISRWRPKPGQDEEFEKRSIGPRETLRTQPGVLYVYGMKHGDEYFAVHGYSNETMYQKIVHDPEGAFARSVEQSEIEDVADWVESWKGDLLD